MLSLRLLARPTFAALLLTGASVLPAFAPGYAPPPPANDDCANATPISISGGGFDYGTFNSTVSDMTMATGQAGEHFAFPGHSKSVWYEVTLPTHRNFQVRLVPAPGSTIAGVSLTLYLPVGCLPAGGNLISAQSGDDGGIVQNNTCGFGYGSYKIQVSTAANMNASVFVEITLACPDADVARYDCPANAYLFNAGNPLPQGQISSNAHNIGCQSLDTADESDCLPLPNKADYLQSAWYVFKTGSPIDLLSIRFNVPSGEKVGYRLFQGDVRPAGPAGLTQIACDLAKEDYSTRFIEFPCLLQPNTTYSIALFFHKNFTTNGNTFSLTMRQRGVTATGWPKPVLPPVLAANQLGVLPGGGANGTMTPWLDRFDCNAFISKNICPPANPAAGTVVVGTKTYNLATWATFTLASDANVEFDFFAYNYYNAFHTRIFKKTIPGNCPSPDPATTDLYYEFSGTSGQAVCMPAGDYAIQVLSSSVYPLPTSSGYWDAWSYGNLGTTFQLHFTVLSLPTTGLFRLDSTGKFNAVNALNDLQNNILYPSTPAVFICENTVLPDSGKCANMTKAMYREVKIGDADGNGTPDSGLLCMSGLRTDYWASPPHVYSFFKGDANQLATAAGTHTYGQKISGLTDYAGFCIDKDDNTSNPPGIDNFCACVPPGTYTLASLGDEKNVTKGDAPGFRFNILKTIHDSRAAAEVIAVGAAPGTYTSGPDVFSCTDNLGSMPPCGNRKKLVFREFFLAADAVVTISEIGNPTSLLSLFSGRASDLATSLTLIAGCANNTSLSNLVNECTPLSGGQWYTIVSYGEGPNYTDKKVWNSIGSAADVGKTTRISITLTSPITPKFNLPAKAHLAGITDWVTPPPANPNATTGKIFDFPTEYFCAPDTPFIPNGMATCAPGYNRVAFYVFEITKMSFVQIRNVDQSFYTEVFPFDANAQPGALLTVPPVYQCLSATKDYRQICDLPPGKYTLVIFANDTHKGLSVSPSIYVEEVALSRFDHAWNAYDFDLVPASNTFVHGKTGDIHPFLTGQHPSRDVFYCTTGATTADPTETRCNTQINPHIYAQPDGVPKPLFFSNNPPAPVAQPWRNLWYTFMLTGTGECTLQANRLSTGKDRPFVAVYESSANANISWGALQASISSPDDTIIAGLKLVGHNVYSWCDASGDLVFKKNGCLRDSVRYYVVIGFDADYYPNLPNQAISLSIKYAPQPTFAALYDERTTANVVNGLIETAPPYTPVPLSPGNTFVGPDFSLLCYTKNATDPAGCSSSYSGESAWFKFEVAAAGQFYAALQAAGLPNSWLTSTSAFSVWWEPTPGGALVQLPLNDASVPGEPHRWQEGCISPGTYYLLVRYCTSQINPIQPYRVVLKLTDSPGDFCSNAVPLNVPNFSAIAATVTPDCHTIGTDFGETTAAGMGCLFGPTGKKTSWIRATVTAGPKMDIKFQLAENLAGANFNDLSYRIFFGSCGALTPIVCSAVGSNIITQNCLAPGDYYVQVAMPEKVGSTAVEGTLTLTVTATANNDPNCAPPDLSIPKADFSYTADCQSVSFTNLSTAGADIAYFWQFPDNSTSTAAVPNWAMPPGTTGSITLTVTNTALNKSASVTKPVSVVDPFDIYMPLPDTAICNNSGPVTLDATLPGATYLWDNGDTTPTRSTGVAGEFWVKITKDGCEKIDTAIVDTIHAQRTIAPTLCPDESITVGDQVFDRNTPGGIVTLTNAHPSGCDSVLTVALSFYAPATSAFSTTICEGEVIFFGNQNRTESGVYTDTLPLTSVFGCDSVVTLTLTVTSPQTLYHVAYGCTGAALSLQSTTIGIAYIWNTGAMTESISVNVSGTYTVSVSDAAGCVISEETFSVTLLPTVFQNISAEICSGHTYTLPDSTKVGISGTYSGAFVDAATGCPGIWQVALTVVPMETTERDTAICAGALFTLPWGDVVMPGMNASFSHAWQYAAGGCDSARLTVHVSVEQPTVQFAVSDFNGFGVACFGTANGSVNVAAFNATPPYRYLWNTGDTTTTVVNASAGIYTVTATSANGCTVVGNQTLTQPPGIVLTAAKTDPTCFGSANGTITASVLGGMPVLQFSLNGGIFQQNPTFGNLPAGIYALTVRDANGCLDSVLTALAEPPEMVLELMAQSPLCPVGKPVGSVSATAWGGQPPLLFALGSGAFSTVSHFNNLPPGFYEVTTQDVAGCEASAEIEVEQPALLPLSLPSVLTLKWSDSVLLIPQIGFQADSIAWSPAEGLSCTNCLYPWANPVRTTGYELNVWSPEGCLVTARVQVEVKREVRIYVPNVFHPNDSGVNDAFTVFGGPEVRSVRNLSVYDRWGGEAWQKGNFPANGSVGWNGRSRGKPMSPGVYVWVCEIELIDGTIEVLSGDVTVLR